MVRRKSHNNLDSTDLRLIAELETNPRQSYINLAKMLGVDETTVKRRVNRLLKEKTISFWSAVNIAAIDHQWAVIGLNVSPRYAEPVAKELARHPWMNVNITSGRYDVMAWTAYKELGMLFDFIAGDLGKITNITSVETFPAMRVLKYSPALIGNADRKPFASRMVRSLDKCDWSILAALEENPRMTHTYLAKQLGISRPTAGTKLKRLLDEDAVRIYCVASPSALGYELHLTVLLKVRPDSLLNVAEQLIVNESVHRLLATSGQYDLMAWATFKSPNDMSDFLMKEQGTIPGIVSSDNVLHLKALSRSPFSVKNALSNLQNQKV